MQTAASGSAPLTFRTATEADVPALVALVESAYRGDASRAGWTTEADYLDGQRTDAESVAAIVRGGPDRRVVIAESGGELIACCQLERRDGHGYFGMFAVRPTLQGGGVGKAVLAEAERITRDEWGLGELRLTVVNVRDELIAWYERRGFARTGDCTPFPYGDLRFGLPKRGDLAFELMVRPFPEPRPEPDADANADADA